MTETHVVRDQTLAGQIARVVYKEVGGQRVGLQDIYAMTDSVTSSTATARARKASIRATLQSACADSSQSHSLREYFRSPEKGVWQLTPNTASKLRRAIKQA